jgi:hypothetical protein
LIFFLLVSFVTSLVKNFDSVSISVFVGLPQDLLARVLDTGRLILDEAVIFDRIIRWGYAQLGRPAPASTHKINICQDEPLVLLLNPLLPPRVLLTKRNRQTLLGLNPFHVSSLV